jgi:hypothetical protein
MNGKGKTSQQLSAYLDGELPDVEAGRVRRAVAGDPALARELTELAATRQLLRALPRECAGDDFAARVLAEAERASLMTPTEAERPPSPLRWIRYMATAAVLLIAASVGMIIAVTLFSPDTYESNLALSTPRRHDAPRRGREGGEFGEAGPGGEPKRLALDKAGKTALPKVTAVGTPANKPGPDANDPGPIEGLNIDLNGLELALAEGVQNNEIIFTDRIDLAQRQVESVLLANGLKPAVVRSGFRAAQKDSRAHRRGNYYQANKLTAGTVQYELFVSPDQLPKLQRELSTLRLQQNVSQEMAVLPPATLGDERARAGAALAKEALTGPAYTYAARLAERGADKLDADRKPASGAKAPGTHARFEEAVRPHAEGKGPAVAGDPRPSGPTASAVGLRGRSPGRPVGKVAAKPTPTPKAPDRTVAPTDRTGEEHAKQAGKRRSRASELAPSSGKPAGGGDTSPPAPTALGPDTKREAKGVDSEGVVAGRPAASLGEPVDTPPARSRGRGASGSARPGTVPAPARPEAAPMVVARPIGPATAPAGTDAIVQVRLVQQGQPVARDAKVDDRAAGQGGRDGRLTEKEKAEAAQLLARQAAEARALQSAVQGKRAQSLAHRVDVERLYTQMTRVNRQLARWYAVNQRAPRDRRTMTQPAASQQAAAQLERMLITLNFRVPEGPQGRAMVDALRRHMAEQQRAATKAQQ